MRKVRLSREEYVADLNALRNCKRRQDRNRLRDPEEAFKPLQPCSSKQKRAILWLASQMGTLLILAWPNGQRCAAVLHIEIPWNAFGIPFSAHSAMRRG